MCEATPALTYSRVSGTSLVGYLLQSVIGVAIGTWEGAPGVTGNEPSVLEIIGTYGLVTILYLPMWAIVLSPLALLWVLTVRVLRGQFGHEPDDASTSRALPRRKAQSGNLLWPPLAALIAYLAGFSLVTPWGCAASSTVGAEASLVAGTMTVCRAWSG